MNRLVRPVIILAVVGVLGYLFYQSVRSTRSAPFTMEQRHFAGWTVTAETAALPAAAVLSVRLPRDIASGLFRQLFQRVAESMNGPSVPIIALLLQEEFQRSFAGATDLEGLAAAARSSGIAGSAFVPRCMGLKRDSAPGVTRQLYFVLFDAPAFTQFRQRIASLTGDQATYDPAALSPVLFVAASDANFTSWLPLRADADSDCVAPVAVE